MRRCKRAHHLVEVCFDRQQVHIGPRHHDFAHLYLAELDRAGNEFFFAGSEQAAFTRLLNLDLQLFGRVNGSVNRRLRHAEATHNHAGNPVQQIDRPAKRLEKPRKRPRDQQGDPFGASEAHSFGDKFANHDVKGAQHRERQTKRNGMGNECRSSRNRTRKKRLKHRRKCALAQSAERKARKCNSELNGGNDAVQIGEQRLDHTRPRVALLDKLPHARQPHRHQ